MPRPRIDAAVGREAVYEGGDPKPRKAAPKKAAAKKTAAKKKPAEQLTWAERMERATFHVPKDLHQAVREEAERSGRTKSQVVVDAVREHLGHR